jgi:Na+/melibiose symporter-like transporter
MREAISGGKFAALNGRRTMIMNISVAASGLAMGFWLERAPFPLNYQVMFVVAFLISMVSWWHVDRVKIIPELSTPSPSGNSQRVNPWKSGSFQLVAIIVALCFVSFTAIRPILSLYMVNTLHADEWFFSNFGLIELVAGALIAAFTVPLVNRFGNRTLIALGLVGTGVAALIIAAAQSLPVTLISAAIGGAAWAIVSIGQSSYFGEMTPTEHKEPFTTAYQQNAFISVLDGPIIGQLFISANMPMVTAICIGAGLRVAAGILTQARPRQWFSRALEIGYSSR